MFVNQLKTFVLLVVIGGLLMIAGSLIGGSQGALVALVFAAVMNFGVYYFSDRMVLSAYGAKPLSKEHFPEIYRMVQELSDQAGIPMPKLYLIDLPMANAFATGRSPQHSAVAVTSGILNLLSPEELRGVLAHEISHVKNRDILIATVAATFAMAIGYIASVLRWSFIFGNRNDDSRGSGFGALIAAMILPIAATLIQLAISRSREYEADATGAVIGRDPLALASALQKIAASSRLNPIQNATYTQQAASSMFICNPFTAKSLSNMFSTHPPIEDRIKRLKDMASRSL